MLFSKINIGDYMVYFYIFILKIIENMISTLRAIIISNGKKILGAILLFIVSIIWIISNSITIININIISILVFSFGSLFGSLIGSIIEEKLAFGNCLIICISSINIYDILRKKGYIITTINGNGMTGTKNIMLIILKRKRLKQILNTIKSLDNDAIIINAYTNID